MTVAIFDEAQDLRQRFLESDSVDVALPAALSASAKLTTLIAGGTYVELTVRQKQDVRLIASALRQLDSLGTAMVLGVPPTAAVSPHV